MSEKKTQCYILGECSDLSGLIFVCKANDPDFGSEGFSGCDFTDGYKNRCPYRKCMDCTSVEAQRVAIKRLKIAIEAEEEAYNTQRQQPTD